MQHFFLRCLATNTVGTVTSRPVSVTAGESRPFCLFLSLSGSSLPFLSSVSDSAYLFYAFHSYRCLSFSLCVCLFVCLICFSDSLCLCLLVYLSVCLVLPFLLILIRIITISNVFHNRYIRFVYEYVFWHSYGWVHAWMQTGTFLDMLPLGSANNAHDEEEPVIEQRSSVSYG